MIQQGSPSLPRSAFAAALKPPLPPRAPLYAADPARPQGFSAQVANNTTGYNSAGAGLPAGSQTQQPAPTTNAPAAPGDTTPPATGAYDLSTDPIVQKIRALNTANYGTAVANAQATAKQDLISSGFNFTDVGNPDLAGSPISSVLADQATNEAAAGNPYSTRQQLADTHAHNAQTIDQAANDNNLYYSSTRANQLGQEAHDYLGSVTGAQGTLAQALSALLGGLSTEQQHENTAEADAIEQARQNAITNAIASGQTFSGYDANGNPIFTTHTTLNPGVNGPTGNVAQGGNIVTNGVDTGIPDTRENALALAAANAASAGQPTGNKAQGGTIIINGRDTGIPDTLANALALAARAKR